MTDLKLSFTIEALDHVLGPLRKIRDGVQGTMRDVRSAVEGTFGAAERLGNSAGGILGALGAGIELKQFIDTEAYFQRLRVQFNLTADASKHLHDSIVASARTSRVSSQELVAALKSSTELTGDVRNFGANVETAAAMIGLLGAQGDEVGRVMGDLDKHFKITGPEEMRKTLAALYKQSYAMPGGFAEMTAGLDRVAEHWSQIRGSGSASAREFGALFATFASGTGSARRASSDLDIIVGAFGDKTGELYKALIAASGLQWGETDIVKVLRAVSTQYRASPLATTAILGPDLSRDISMIDFDLLNRKIAATGDSAKFLRDAAEATHSFAGQLDALHAALEQFENRELTGPLRFLTDMLGRFPDASAAVIATVGALALFGIVAAPIRTGAGAAMFLFRALGLVKTEAPLAGAAVERAGAVAALAAPKIATASERMLGLTGRLNQLRAAVGIAQLGFMVGDIQQLMDDWDAARAKGPDALKQYEASRRQSFGAHAFGWIPGLGGIDWNAHASDDDWLGRNIPGLNWLRRSLRGDDSGAAHPMSLRGGVGPSPLSDLLLGARTLLGEAGNQGALGMAAVADVLRNRLLAGNHGASLRDVILEPKQFSMWNAGDAGQFAHDPRLPQALAILKGVLSGATPDITGGATNYYNPDLAAPAWGPQMSGRRRIGAHVFGTAPGEPGYGKQEITVKFLNAPQGTRASVTKRDDSADIALDMGWSMVTP